MTRSAVIPPAVPDSAPSGAITPGTHSPAAPGSGTPQPGAPQSRPPLLWLQATVFTVTLLVAVIGVPWYGLSSGFHWSVWPVGLVVLWANGFSITAGYHRLWSHKTYQAHWSVRLFFALFGAAALQNSILAWASGHRRHHRHVDDIDQDPYTIRRGLWFAHIGWMLRQYPSGAEDFGNVRDLQRDAIVAWQHRHYLPLAIGMNLAPALLAGLLLGDVWGHLLVAGFLRLVINHHVTFCINSIAHYWGRRPYTDDNSARDNGWVALLTYGEGYHNFHHMFQTDYRNGVRWWQFDPTKWLIRAASWLGLTWDLKQVPGFRIQQALLAMQFKRAQRSLALSEHAEHLREHLEREYQQFLAYMQEWSELRLQWMDSKRQRFQEAREELQRKWRHTGLHCRLRELEYAVKMQRKRLQFLTLQLAAPC